MKLSIVIICWNDLKVILDCLKSIHAETEGLDFEVIVSDNGSTDASVQSIKSAFPKVTIVENRANLGFAKGNNVGIRLARGQYILILNPDTIIHDRALERLVDYADTHPEGGAFGCRVLNKDGTLQDAAHPLPSVGGFLLGGLGLGWLGRFSDFFPSDRYAGWDRKSERELGFQGGACILFRGDLLRRLGGFDERFFYQYEETDLCCRVWQAGHKVLFFPGATITHLGGQSVGRFPIRFALETYRSGYRFFYKHHGPRAVVQMRRIYLLHLWIRRAGYTVLKAFKPSDALQNRLKLYRVAIRWHSRLDPRRFIDTGDEPNLGYEPLAPAPKMSRISPAGDECGLGYN
jgi:hypothetical protein